MKVKDRMSSPVITVWEDTPFQDALKVMHEKKIRRLPVVDHYNHLLGIVSERDLLHAAPSPATSLSVWELNYLLWKLTVGSLMTRKTVTATPETSLVEAAQLMINHKIGGLPVIDHERRVIGVITETDIFKAFVELVKE